MQINFVTVFKYLNTEFRHDSFVFIVIAVQKGGKFLRKRHVASINKTIYL